MSPVFVKKNMCKEGKGERELRRKDHKGFFFVQ